ncbi:MAG: hypothetical protein M1817_000212 [Caeruleum heppii]|nr:MAG: hypothetical protein M1817_000212 [Caeruleum heppii]
MVGFNAPLYSPSLPSTPDSRSRRSDDDGSPLPPADPSTTPAGPPPSSAPSFTPAGAPPSSIFGSSQLGGHDITGPSVFAGLSRPPPSSLFGSPNPTLSRPPDSTSPAGPPPSSIFGTSKLGSHNISGSPLFPASPQGSTPNFAPSKSSFSFGNLGASKSGSNPFSIPQTNSPSGQNLFSFSNFSPTHTSTARVPGKLRHGVSANDPSPDVEIESNEDVVDESESEGEDRGSSELSDGDGQDDRGGDMASDANYEDEDAEGETDDAGDMEAEEGIASGSRRPLGELGGHAIFNPFQQGPAVKPPLDPTIHQTDPTNATPDPLRESPGDDSIYDASPSANPAIARGISQKTGPAKLHESNEVLLTTDDIISRMQEHVSNQDSQDPLKVSLLVQDLVKLWDAHPRDGSLSSYGPDRTSTSIKAPLLDQAATLATLLLQIHHPPSAQASNTFTRHKASRSTAFSQTFNARSAGHLLPMPKVLFNWLDSYHDPLPELHARLETRRESSTANSDFWDNFWGVVTVTLQRGKVDQVIRLLKEADFRHAVPRGEDVAPTSLLGQSSTQSRFSEIQLGNIRRVVNRAIQLLEQCPAVTQGDWDLRGNEWAIFRARVAQAKEDLAVFAEGTEHDAQPQDDQLEAEHFGIRSRAGPSFSMSEASRMMGSKVPWSVYQDLRAIYTFLEGDTDVITTYAEHWIDATICLTAWWDGERQLPRRSPQSLGTRSIYQDGSCLADALEDGYKTRLADSFAEATHEMKGTSQVDTLNPVEVGLACIFEADVEGAVGILRSLSLSVAAAVVEIASSQRWLHSGNGPLPVNFDQSDLMVLSYGQPRTPFNRDSILVEYAEALFGRDPLGEDTTDDGGIAHVPRNVNRPNEGWELGLRVLGRAEDVEMAAQKVERLLNRLPLDSGDRIDKVLRVCGQIGLAAQARKLAENYADGVAEQSHQYGEALIYYALAHQRKKTKDVLDLLVSFCLVQSMAYPPASELDPRLQSLMASPRDTLTDVAEVDKEAAEMLHIYLCGYASLRKFYNLRDANVGREPGTESSGRERGRIRQAANALLALINSAGSNIRDGLYDASAEAVVSVDGLLALLGESMVFLNRPEDERVLSLDQIYTLLKVIEDLQSVPTPVYSQCEEFVQSALAASNDPRSSGATLKKTLSSMTASSGSVLGRSMLESFTMTDSMESGGSGVLVKRKDGTDDNKKRGWDWRGGLVKGAKGEDVLRILRLGLAKELATAWVEERPGGGRGGGL